MMFDHYRMSGPTFAPHPHAGLSAVTYVFEDSAGAIHNRDSLGHDLDVQPGEILWTQAGSGVVHDEYPAKHDASVHGLQLFVNLTARTNLLRLKCFMAVRRLSPYGKMLQEIVSEFYLVN
jgi:redox-sensitive bicupin YhaK (pirin superfamily)